MHKSTADIFTVKIFYSLSYLVTFYPPTLILSTPDLADLLLILIKVRGTALMDLLKNNKSLFYVCIIMIAPFFTNIAQAAQCVKNWSDIQKLKPISGIKNLENVIASKNITFKISGGKDFTLKDRSGRIYAVTPMGSTDIQLCKLPNGELVATAHTILGTKTVSVTPSRGKFIIINSDSPSERLEATIQ